MAVANGLELNQDPDRPILSEVENNLVAHTINFQKIFVLQKSRWAAAKGKTICVPVRPDDIMNTVGQLPRLPKEAELIPVKLKRKKQYKGHEKSEWIRPEKLFRALRFFRKAGHPHYRFFDDEETYLARCKAKDQLKLLTSEDARDDLEEELDKMPDDGEDEDLNELTDEAVDEEDESDEDLEVVLEREEEDIQNDPVRRQHFKYNEYSALVNGHPTIFLDENGNQVFLLLFLCTVYTLARFFIFHSGHCQLVDIENAFWSLVIQGGFFNCSRLKISRCQLVSKVKPKKFKYLNCSYLEKNKERKKLKYPNCSHPINVEELQYFDFHHTNDISELLDT